MSKNFWRPSAEQRRTILLLEALGLIHDLGKLSDTFLKWKAGLVSGYRYKLLADPRRIRIYQFYKSGLNNNAAEVVKEWIKDANNKKCAFGERADLTSILDSVHFTDWTNTTYSFAELAVPLLTSPGLAKILPDEWKQALGKGMHPGLLIGKMHGVAHVEKDMNKKDTDDRKQPYPDVFSASPFGKEERIGSLTKALNALPLDRIQEITTKQRREWLKEMRTWMQCGLADNRRPLNEVSLWDWGFVVGTMTKAAAAYIYNKGWPGDLEEIPFRTLRISLNKLEIYTHSDRISDLLGVRQAIDDAFAQVQILLEETYALGNCIYHDESGAYYLLTDLYDSAEQEALRQEIQALFPPDLLPRVYWGEKIIVDKLDKDKTLSKELVVNPREEAIKEPSVYAENNLYLFKEEWDSGRPENAEVCSVCGIRPVGFPHKGSLPAVEKDMAIWATQEKAEQRNICRVCLDRRGRRAKNWLESSLQGTIWTNEVADENGRIALFVGKLGLKSWLDGSLLWTTQDEKTNKHPSPARLYRIAETACRFWEEISNELILDVVNQRPYRLALYPDCLLQLGDFNAYEFEVDGVRLSVVWDEDNRRFLTAENLDYFGKRWEWKGKNKNKKDLLMRLEERGVFSLRESSEYGRPGQVLYKEVRVKKVEKLDGYYPVIPILAEPGIFMALVPADKALALAHAVKNKYEAEMGRVRDRLPLYLGLVFCPRRTPIRAVLEAGRSMLAMDGSENMNTGEGWEAWNLRENDSSKPGIYRLSFGNGNIWVIHTYVGEDKTKQDHWYPKMFVGDTWGEKQVKHVSELSFPDTVWVRPSRFDFEYLDANTRRFDIYYDEKGRRLRPTRPFYLEDLDRFERLWSCLKRLTKTQRRQLIRIIETTRETWYGQGWKGESVENDEVFKQFVADTLAELTKVINQMESVSQEKKGKLIQEIIQAAVKGELADIEELYTEILKKE